MRHSLHGLREAAEQYERQATQHHWDELRTARGNITELESLAAKAVIKKQKSSSTGMERFSSVALEYSKLLDVVMNGCPEYASLVWGIMKLLLFANIAHAKLKANVENHLISIGEQTGLITQFVYYNPTEKMAEAVGRLYADFSKFLEKAIRYYAKSKLGKQEIEVGIVVFILMTGLHSHSP